jgi:hypothetical protein
LFVAAVIDPRYKIIILEFWFKSNVGEEKAERIITKLKNTLEQLYNHYAKNVMNVGGSGDKSNEEESCGNSASVGAGTSTTSISKKKNALTNFHLFRASKNLALCKTESERYFRGKC